MCLTAGADWIPDRWMIVAIPGQPLLLPSSMAGYPTACLYLISGIDLEGSQYQPMLNYHPISSKIYTKLKFALHNRFIYNVAGILMLAYSYIVPIKQQSHIKLSNNDNDKFYYNGFWVCL